MSKKTELGRATTRLERAVTEPMTRELVACFYEAERPFVGATFLEGDWASPGFNAMDILAVNLMLPDPIPSLATRRLLQFAREHMSEFFALPAAASIIEDPELLDPGGPADRAWYWLRDPHDGIGPVTAGKLMARKRPGLVPIVDQTVEEYLGLSDREWYWEAFALFFSDPTCKALLDGLASAAPETTPPLRLLDSAVYMWRSEGEAAEEARKDLGVDRLASESR